MDVSIVLALLDEIDRLKDAFVPRPLQSHGATDANSDDPTAGMRRSARWALAR